MAEDLCVLHFQKTIAQSVLALEVCILFTATLEGMTQSLGWRSIERTKEHQLLTSKVPSTANQVSCLGRSVGYARHYWIAQKSLDSGCIVFFVSEANIISVFLQETHKSPVCLMGNNTWKASCSFQKVLHTNTLETCQSRSMIACPRSLNSVVRWKHFPSPTLAPHSLFDIGKLDIQQVKCVLRVTKLVNGTAGLLSSIEIGY